MRAPGFVIAAAGALALSSALAALPGGAMAAERLLVQDSDLLVVVDRETACGDPVPITIRSASADLFGQGSARLQHVVDGVRAILAFECARTPRLDITGERGPRGAGAVFQGQAGDDTGWLVEAAMRAPDGAGDPGGAASGAMPAGGPLSLGGAGGAAAPSGVEGMHRIAGVSLGMTLEAARQGAAAEFGTAPSYQEGQRMLRAVQGGCDFRFAGGQAPQPGWRCLEAAFTGGSPPVLHALGVSQAVDRDQRDAVVETLVERFGEPEQVLRGTRSGHPYVFLAWDAVVAEERGDRLPELDAPLRGLEAYVLARDGVTVLTIWNQDAGASGPQHRVRL